MPTRRSSNGSAASDDRLEPKLLRAAEANSVDGVRDVVQDAQRHGRSSDRFLATGLLRSSEKGSLDVARYLLSQGNALTDFVIGNRLPPLLRTIEYGHTRVAELLIEHGANLEATDKKGRTALMTAAWRNRLQTLRLLLSRGANVNATDSKKRNVVHNLAADKVCAWDDQIIDALLQTDVQIAARDDVGRIPLHWACVTGKTLLAEKLLTHHSASRAGVSAEDKRMKTPLHFAAFHDRLDMVDLLLSFGANIHARSDGGWSVLHSACEKGSVQLVNALLQAGADLNSRLLNGRTPLHVAAEAGNTSVVRRLLQRNGIKMTVKDGFGNTPLLRAAQLGKKDIVDLLAPWNHVEALSVDALGACNGFVSTIVDFGNYHNENKVTKKSVYELLYGRDPQDPSKHAVSTLPKNVKATNFRWIHLPANNIAWCDALLTKRFIEEGATDVEGFKALEKSFTHQHRGQQLHSHYMRPLCQVVPRAPSEAEKEDSSKKPETPSIVINGQVTSTKEAVSEVLRPKETGKPKKDSDGPNGTISSSTHSTGAPPKAMHHSGLASDESRDAASPKQKRQNKQADYDSRKSKDTSKKPKDRPANSPRKGGARKTFASAPPKRGIDSTATCNIYLFSPFLHFETDRRRQEMQKAIEHVEKLGHTSSLIRSSTFDEMLIRGHLTASSSVLHIRRTLDQFFYHNIDTTVRDRDQVVYRYQKRNKNPGDPAVDPKIFMVDQLWMWILGKDLIMTSFPQRWQQPRNDPMNVLEGIIEDINSKTREPVQNVYELAMLISGRCFGTFDRHRLGDSEYQFLDMFEASIGKAMDQETVLFQEFSGASQQASAWLQHQQRPTRFSRNLEATSRTHTKEAAKQDVFRYEDYSPEPLFVDKLLDIGQETDLLAEIKDIREELYMIRMVIENQQQVLPEMKKAIHGIYEEARSEKQVRKLDLGYEEQEKTINTPLKDISRMDKQAERIYHSITDLLDLKQKHANAFEARFARDQAAGTARQGQTIMVFTIVTVVFLPLSFIATFFAINIADFPHDSNGTQALSLSYVSKHLFGIGIAISIPCIFVALSVDELGYLFNKMRRKSRILWPKWRGGEDMEAERHMQTLSIEHTLSLAKSMRRSMEVGWQDRAFSPITRRTTDIERDGQTRGYDGVL